MTYEEALNALRRLDEARNGETMDDPDVTVVPILDSMPHIIEALSLREATKTKGYIVDCSTGCSCCESDNHRRGPFSCIAIAEEACRMYRAVPILASQYASRGCYSVSEHDAEVLADGRVIVENVVFPGWCDKSIGCDDVVEIKL